MSSPHVGILGGEMWKMQKPRQGDVAGFLEYVDYRLDLDQAQFFCPPDSRPAAIDIQFAVDALRVSANRA
jgi:hypothetical protein